MARFWARRIKFDLDRLGEVPKGLREKTRVYILEHPEELSTLLSLETM